MQNRTKVVGIKRPKPQPIPGLWDSQERRALLEAGKVNLRADVAQKDFFSRQKSALPFSGARVVRAADKKFNKSAAVRFEGQGVVSAKGKRKP